MKEPWYQTLNISAEHAGNLYGFWKSVAEWKHPGEYRHSVYICLHMEIFLEWFCLPLVRFGPAAAQHHMGWDKNCLLRQKRKREVLVMIIIIRMCIYIYNIHNKWHTSIWSPSADWYPVSPHAVLPPGQLPSVLLFPLTMSYGKSLWPVWVTCPGSVPSQLCVPPSPVLAGQYEKLKRPWLSNNWNTAVLSTVFFSYSQNIASFQTQRCKSSLSQLKPGQSYRKSLVSPQ